MLVVVDVQYFIYVSFDKSIGKQASLVRDASIYRAFTSSKTNTWHFFLSAVPGFACCGFTR